MKTIKQWIAEGITKVRLPQWNKWAYLKFSGTSNGLLHPWAYLYDIGCNGTPELIYQFMDIEFEEWIPPLDYDKRKDEIYKEF